MALTKILDYSALILADKFSNFQQIFIFKKFRVPKSFKIRWSQNCSKKQNVIRLKLENLT